jgi:imidazolonepropionase-like amidohydrolase
MPDANGQQSFTLINNARIFDGRGDSLSDPTSVLVAGNKIELIAGATGEAPPGARVIDGGGRTLTPGFIDAHSHLLLNIGGPEAQDIHISYAYYRGAATARSVLMQGFTAVREAAGPSFGLKMAIDKGLVAGPRIFPSGSALSQTSGHMDHRSLLERTQGDSGQLQDFLGMIADGRDQVLAAVRENLRQGASQIKLMVGGGVASRRDPIDTAQYTGDEIRAAVEAADDWGTYVLVHAYTPRSIRRAIEAGVKCIEHGNLLDEPTAELMAVKDIWLSPQMVVFMSDMPFLTPDQQAKQQQVREGLVTMFELARKYQLRIAFGTDLVGSLRAYEAAKLEFGYRLQYFTAAEVLRQATSNSADLLELSGLRNPYPGKLGVIAEGAYADLLLIDGDPLQDPGLLADPEKNLVLIIKDGQIVKDTSARAPAHGVPVESVSQCA